MFDPLIIAEAKGKQTAAEERLEGAPPTHPLATYVGTYEAEGYPDFAVKLAGEGLQACTVGRGLSQNLGTDRGARGVSPRIPPGLSRFPKIWDAPVGSLDWSELRHYHYNVFEWNLADFDVWLKIHFLVNDNGEIDAVSIPIEEAVENVTFVRQQPELSAELIAALVGEYDPARWTYWPARWIWLHF